MSALTRRSRRLPWHEFEDFDDHFQAVMAEMLGRIAGRRPSETGAWSPAVELVETDDELELSVELAGMDRDDIEIELENGVVTIRGEKCEEHKEKDEKRRYHVWERSFGKFQRSFSLPREVDSEKIAAEFEKGVLKVHMPKTAEAKGRRIKIIGK